VTRRVERLAIRTFPLIFAAPSGAGKTAIVSGLLDRRGDVAFSVSVTTRPQRAYERDGEHYRFVREAEFRRRVDQGGFLEWAEVHGNLYGTPRSNLEEAVEQDRYLLLDIDIQGARQVRRQLPEAVSIFVLPPSGHELARRLSVRGSEELDVQRRRLGNARAELQAAGEFDYIVVNDVLEDAVAAVETILTAESARTSRMIALEDEIARIDAEVDQRLGAE
jgi:guanylate kinase